jgi:hypothetical protein
MSISEFNVQRYDDFNNLLIIWETSDLRSECQPANSFIEKRHEQMKPVISGVNVRHIVAH